VTQSRLPRCNGCSPPRPRPQPSPRQPHLPLAVIALPRRPHICAEAVHQPVAPLAVILRPIRPHAGAQAIGQPVLECPRVPRAIGRSVVVDHIVHGRARAQCRRVAPTATRGPGSAAAVARPVPGGAAVRCRCCCRCRRAARRNAAPRAREGAQHHLEGSDGLLRVRGLALRAGPARRERPVACTGHNQPADHYNKNKSFKVSFSSS
jgi:hypothetical protein